MNDRAVSVFEQYDCQILRTMRGRGAILGETETGWVILKEYTGPASRLELQEKLLLSVRENGFATAEQLLRNREGELLSRDQDRTAYIVKTYAGGRECNLRDGKECQQAVRCLGRLHRAMELPGLVPESGAKTFSLTGEYAKHNRELKKVRRYLRMKGQKTDFEIFLLHHYDFFYEQALEAARALADEEVPDREPGRASFCHGDFQQHNLLWQQDGFHVINFERYILDNPVRDLYLFLRKLLEKNSWSPSLGLSILTAYETQRTLTREDRRQLGYRFAYPEKFWKIVNFYYNSGKAWIPGRNREKLESLLAQEGEKKMFLETVLK